MSQPLLIVGASVRPWVTSALGAGFRVRAFDFFADWDTQRFICESESESTIQRIDHYQDVVELDGVANCAGAVICGGFENRIDLARELDQFVPVLGTKPDDLAQLSAATIIWEYLRGAGLQVPEFKLNLQPQDQAAGWLRKTIGSSGGVGVRRAGLENDFGRDERVYYQAFVEGQNLSAMFVSFKKSSRAVATRLVGLTHQLVGLREFGAEEFRYCGSIGPISLGSEATNQIQRFGQFLAEEFGLTGVWGMDFILNNNGVWPVDLNARLTASMELFESGLRQSGSPRGGVIELHHQACQGALDEASLSDQCLRIKSIEGKAILFNGSGSELQIDTQSAALIQSKFDAGIFQSDKTGFSVADVPPVGETIKAGHPILTLRFRGHQEAEVARILRVKAREMYSELGMAAPVA